MVAGIFTQPQPHHKKASYGHKKRDKYLLQNWQQVSLWPEWCKVFEKIISNRISEFLADNFF